MEWNEIDWNGSWIEGGGVKGQMVREINVKAAIAHILYSEAITHAEKEWETIRFIWNL